MKHRVQGHRRDVFVEPHALLDAAGLPPGWVCNALRSGWFALHDTQARYLFEWHANLIRIPAHFGGGAAASPEP